MTFIAGVVSLGGAIPSAGHLLATMTRSLSRHAGDAAFVARDERAILLKVDIGAFPVEAQIEDDDAITLVAGEPIIPGVEGAARDRMSDTRRLHRSLAREDYTDLQASRGLFSIARYERRTGRLTVATGRLGMRPIYYVTQGELFIFSSALRVLEELGVVEKKIDLQALSEELTVGYPLAGRTLYAGVSLLRAGEVIECAGGQVRLSQYWDWRRIVPVEGDTAAMSAAAYDEFMQAMRLRLGGDRTVTAFLSGGLDSRCVVAALRSLDVGVHSFNLSPPESQDREFGRLFAEAAGTVHEEHLLKRDLDPSWSFTMAALLKATRAPINARVERPRLVWSGDGGSMGVGHLHLSPAIADDLNAGNEPSAIERFVRADCSTLPKRLFTSEFASKLPATPNAAVAAELERLRSPDAAQTFYWFLLQNDQRRLVQSHFEQMDLHRLEFHRPFFDAEFLRVIAQIPVPARLRHAFYVKWLDHFPQYVKTTPWQAYPNHVPCPVPFVRKLGYQWEDASATALANAVRKEMLQKARATLVDPHFPRAAMRRLSLVMAMLAHWSGRRDYRYVVRAAETVERLWRTTGGRFRRAA